MDDFIISVFIVLLVIAALVLFITFLTADHTVDHYYLDSYGIRGSINWSVDDYVIAKEEFGQRSPFALIDSLNNTIPNRQESK